MNCSKKKNSVAIDIYTGKVDVYYLSINHHSFFCASAKKRMVDNIRSVFMLIGQLLDWIKSRIIVLLKKRLNNDWWMIND